MKRIRLIPKFLWELYDQINIYNCVIWIHLRLRHAKKVYYIIINGFIFFFSFKRFFSTCPEYYGNLFRKDYLIMTSSIWSNLNSIKFLIWLQHICWTQIFLEYINRSRIFNGKKIKLLIKVTILATREKNSKCFSSIF